MMDSQENILEKGNQEVKVEETAVETTENNASPAEERKVYTTKKEVLDRVKEIAHGEEAPQKEEVEYLKTAFYKLHIAEREAQLKEYIDGGGDPEAYQITPDEDEEVFKAEMGVIKERRQQIFREQEAEKEENLKKKQAIIEKIKAMVTSPEEASKTYQEFKALQQEWREIKAVPAESANELWRNYQLYVEQFYDLLKLNSEARELDFKKNLEAKTRLCEAAEKLADETDVISAFHQLQQLHQEYREIGPVSKELREEIWQRFKAASTVINKRHQQHFEDLRAREEDNLVKKTALCEKVEAINGEENKGSGDWERHTQEIIAIQAEWKTIGFAPQKMNVKIFERFRAACDDFFARKAEYFKTLKDSFKENADKKRALIEKAKALQDSTEWRSTSDKLIALQKEWKTIGVVPKKLGDQLWEEFLGACNKFFEARNAAGAGQRNEEHENLEKKRDVIERLKAVAEEAGEGLQEKVQKLVEEYNAIGHVPFKEKDKIYEEYHAVLDKLYKELNVSVAKKRLNKFKDNLKQVAERGEGALDNERQRLMRQYDNLKQEIHTYENNLGFLTASSKKGNSLIEEMNRKIQKLKDDMQLVKEKIKAIDAENNA
ncbi:protein of unknown function [Prevotella communis]|uniref:DUF349 domain-containing protein n=1 Tax=Prevotella communis TaxID=2913614 RepID=A0A1H0JBJ0_9BACT|nr:DUF349 domain-containing protein [Prevotella communis]UKK61498.1 DUF349 domain-containing protein [Prevotella communis]UKK64324.1 DUF349 domain-containing protein [Prevotella communis]UKK66666.1 DUF349 domain-containing protein [Prevotella communis]UKK71194.1 DUF349 domain-containing protein [Prevotella communis]SDG68222.1 protein of unknown function [Prevotella communis]